MLDTFMLDELSLGCGRMRHCRHAVDPGTQHYPPQFLRVAGGMKSTSLSNKACLWGWGGLFDISSLSHTLSLACASARARTRALSLSFSLSLSLSLSFSLSLSLRLSGAFESLP